MPTAIAVTSPDLALPATDRQTPAAVVLRAPHLQPLDDALTETSAVLEHHGHLIVLYSSACPPEHIRRLHTLRSVLESDRIAIVPLSLPPLGVALLARQLRQLSLCDFSPGVLASAARLLSHYVHAGALLGSVNGLDRIEVDLRSHVKSWLPGAHFAVLAHPEPQLLHLDRHSTEAGLPAPGFTTQLALARGQLTSEWVTAALAPAWQVQGVCEARLPAESARWWGTQKLIEFAAAIPDLSVLHQLVSSVRREACGWCGLELLGDRCAFCAAPLARERAAGGGGSAQGPAAIGGPVTRPGQGAAVPAATASATATTPAVNPATAPATASGPASAPAPGPSAAPVSPPLPGPAPTFTASPGPASAPAPGPSGGTSAPESPSAAPAGPSPSPWDERGLSPVAPPGVAGVLGVPGGAGGADVQGDGTAGSGGTGQWDVRGPDLAAGGPQASGNPYGSGRPVPGNPYACDDGPRAPGHWHLPGHPDFAAHSELPGHPDLPGRPDVPSHPDVPGRPDVPGTPRTVARVR
ncbi:hypothetical protein ACFTZI_03395 [Streptomyces decoyicus]|uniref:hypothetical protein n=1 Tax=Streptomyces decoyicus TaxID=249567 RepID=UPI00363D7F4D